MLNHRNGCQSTQVHTYCQKLRISTFESRIKLKVPSYIKADERIVEAYDYIIETIDIKTTVFRHVKLTK